MTEYKFFETEVFLRTFDPQDISNWLLQTPSNVILGLTSEIRTRSPTMAAWAKRIERYSTFVSVGEQKRNIRQELISFSSYSIEQVDDINKVAVIGTRVAVAWRDGLHKPDNDGDYQGSFEITPYETFDEQVILNKWASVAPLNMLLGVAKGVLNRASEVETRCQSLLDDLKISQPEESDFNNMRSLVECLDSILHLSQTLMRVAKVGVTYYNVKREPN
jgi:hypothetical protein